MSTQQTQLDRIEAKLDLLIASLAEEEPEDREFDLDGNPQPAAREPGVEL